VKGMDTVYDVTTKVSGEPIEGFAVLKEGMHYGPHSGLAGSTSGKSIKRISGYIMRENSIGM